MHRHTRVPPQRARRAIARVFLALGAVSAPLGAQATVAAGGPLLVEPTRAAVLSLVDSALTHMNTGNLGALSDLMLPEAQVFPARDVDGRGTYSVRTAAQQRAQGTRPPIIERGFDPEVRMAGTIAMVWLPHDLYADGKWSHCGVDVFTLVRVGTSWRIASLAYSVEQPPACRAHPDGPPPGHAAP